MMKEKLISINLFKSSKKMMEKSQMKKSKVKERDLRRRKNIENIALKALIANMIRDLIQRADHIQDQEVIERKSISIGKDF